MVLKVLKQLKYVPLVFYLQNLLVIVNDKIRTHDPTLEVNLITNQLQSQRLERQQSEQLMSTQPRGPNSKRKPAYKKENT